MLVTSSDSPKVRAVNLAVRQEDTTRKSPDFERKDFALYLIMYEDSLLSMCQALRVLRPMGQGSENTAGPLLLTSGNCVVRSPSHLEDPVSLHDNDNWIVP